MANAPWYIWVNTVAFGLLSLFFTCKFLIDSTQYHWHKLQHRCRKHSCISSHVLALKRNISGHNAALTFLNFGLNVLSFYPSFGFQLRGDGINVNAARWIVYTLSCTLLADTIATLLRHTTYYRYIAMALVAATLSCGYWVSVVSDSSARWAFYVLGFAPFLAALHTVVFKRRVRANGAFWLLIVWVAFTWTVYPVAFALGHAMERKIDYKTEVLIYSVTDWFSKMAFSLFAAYGVELFKQ